MGGRVLDYEAKRIHDHGISIGEERGEKRGEKRGITIGEARAVARYEAQIAQLTAALAKAGILME